MTKDDRKRIVKEHEMRTKGISRMIDEGGVGADKYYDIEKDGLKGEYVPIDDQVKKDNDK
ncbi:MULTISPECIES: hypothetical protein [unclassified Sporosarcina]|uniref:hypothetical protein n=1 Tax=unclassified Sporosarcina TaxID=2647733 RepID=UPI000C16FE28|nr:MULTISPECIES: hypothetical protein [unclassified Sporosarcina]PIC98844.1 hypothetical protein CSV68_10520 [Sporosarcina sp. P29]PID04520.1 hypothetical protein CSV66_14855 [Sporosarcina sp. P30]PID07866.1 hypothetical protein CSV65_13915 [Sporosarcina sp. P31]PID10823.1 hypothetical protein CSV64_14890 [Sporosarcina sp. P32b]